MTIVKIVIVSLTFPTTGDKVDVQQVIHTLTKSDFVSNMCAHGCCSLVSFIRSVTLSGKDLSIGGCGVNDISCISERYIK